MKDKMTIADISQKDLEDLIRESLTLPKKQAEVPKPLAEAYVVSANKFDLQTEKLSEENKQAHQELMNGYAKALNEVSAALDSADRENANPNNSNFRNLKMDEVHNLNAAFLHGMFFGIQNTWFDH